ncbi:hypothetical protein PH5382_02904 [Phaeobacter sp. CECT 5382]|nr:hypothetical protein PH5382_02904 [Phaeobacter sp. CECT 5382]
MLFTLLDIGVAGLLFKYLCKSFSHYSFYVFFLLEYLRMPLRVI